MPSPKWAKQPHQNQRTVALTPHGWVAKETSELLVSCKNLATRIAKILNVTTVAFKPNNLVLTKSIYTLNLDFDKICEFLRSPGSFFVPVSKISISPPRQHQ